MRRYRQVGLGSFRVAGIAALCCVLVIGLAQALALIPGTSRSGITITAGLMLGLKREAAARFSFLLSIPVIFLAGSLETLEYLSEASIQDATPLLTGALISAISAYACIHYFLKLLERIGKRPLLDLDMRLGEGSGAMAAVPLIAMACAGITDVPTFEEWFGT